MDKGTTVQDVANGFVHSAEFATLYGIAPSNADIVTRLYQNVLHREPEKAGFDYWLGVLDKGTDLATVLAAFSESAENHDGTAELIANGIAYTPYGG
jgi:hypothetical protein